MQITTKAQLHIPQCCIVTDYRLNANHNHLSNNLLTKIL
ncbi:hypothetical protein [uncultured Gammaproteobacteria bacterium]|nr:hypothetical protein [uncultured Gammaproteobacteria bacterium]